jgi:YD repeat-containing protein
VRLHPLSDALFIRSSFVPVSGKNDTYLCTIVGNRLSGKNTTTYTSDAASNLLTATLPSGLQSIFTCDTLDRLTQLTTPDSRYNYQLGAVGNRTAVTEGNGRTVTWNYDGVYRPTNETSRSVDELPN